MACFNGKSIWESFCREILPGTYKKRDFAFGRQDIAPLQGIKTVFYVMASSSARCAAFPTAETKLPFFREVKNIKGKFYPLFFTFLVFFSDKLKSDESAKGLAGLASIGGNLPKFTGHDISPKVYSGSPRPPGMDDAKERKGKKRPIEESDHPKSKLKHMVSHRREYGRIRYFNRGDSDQKGRWTCHPAAQTCWRWNINRYAQRSVRE